MWQLLVQVTDGESGCTSQGIISVVEPTFLQRDLLQLILRHLQQKHEWLQVRGIYYVPALACFVLWHGHWHLWLQLPAHWLSQVQFLNYPEHLEVHYQSCLKQQWLELENRLQQWLESPDPRQQAANRWLKRHGWTDLQYLDHTYWAIPPGAVIPLPIPSSAVNPHLGLPRFSLWLWDYAGVLGITLLLLLLGWGFRLGWTFTLPVLLLSLSAILVLYGLRRI